MTNPSPFNTVARKKYDFRWEVLDVIVSGKSTLDSVYGLNIPNLPEADRFMKSYGYDLENPIEQAHVFGHFQEALNFIRKYFLQPENALGLRLELPRRILELMDVRELFLMACLSAPGQNADASGQLLRNWACSVLKVMHTVAHLDQDLRSSYFTDIQKQIFDRFYRFVQRDMDGVLYLGEKPDDLDRVDLVAFETKPKKSRDSTLIKLLHKPENVAEDIFDRVGLRFITHTRLAALRVVGYLKDHRIIVPPNIKPSRSRNTLVALDAFRAQLPDVLARAEAESFSEERLTEELERIVSAPAVNPDNPHSSEFYRAIQFTGRQLIRLTNPLYDDIRELRARAKAVSVDEELLRVIERIDLKYVQREIRFFYPYEVQVLDVQSSDENERGRSAHHEYKKAQLQTAMRRVMGPLLDVGRSG